MTLHPGMLPANVVHAGVAPATAVRGPAPGAGVVQAPTPDGSTLSGGSYGRLRARQDDLNELAQALRGQGAGADGVEPRKLFPPYPPDQEARMAYLDRISGLRRQIEALMFPAAQVGETKSLRDDPANALAEDISRDSQRLLAALTSTQSISSNRPLLEVVARIDPVQ